MSSINMLKDPSVPTMYQRIAYDTSLLDDQYIDERDESKIDIAHRDYVIDLLKIEAFVRRTLSSKQDAFTMGKSKFGTNKLYSHPLSKYFTLVINLFERVSPEYEYSAHVELFFQCCFALKLGKEWFRDPLACSSQPKLQYQLFNELIDLIRTESKKPEFKAKIAAKKYKPERRQRSAEEAINKAFRIYSRLQVLRIDFSYQYEHAKNISAEDAKADLQHFLHNRRSKPRLFAKCVFYLWKLEWGPEKGYHFHLIFFYKGRDIWKDAYWAFQIGEYWRDVITKGKGCFFNCNASKDKYHRLGIGLIDRADLLKRKILLEDVVGYLTKTDQYLRAVRLGNDRCFGKGVPRKKSNAGRPRDDDDELRKEPE